MEVEHPDFENVRQFTDKEIGDDGSIVIELVNIARACQVAGIRNHKASLGSTYYSIEFTSSQGVRSIVYSFDDTLKTVAAKAGSDTQLFQGAIEYHNSTHPWSYPSIEVWTPDTQFGTSVTAFGCNGCWAEGPFPIVVYPQFQGNAPRATYMKAEGNWQTLSDPLPMQGTTGSPPKKP